MSSLPPPSRTPPTTFGRAFYKRGQIYYMLIQSLSDIFNGGLFVLPFEENKLSWVVLLHKHILNYEIKTGLV